MGLSSAHRLFPLFFTLAVPSLQVPSSQLKNKTPFSLSLLNFFKPQLLKYQNGVRAINLAGLGEAEEVELESMVWISMCVFPSSLFSLPS